MYALVCSDLHEPASSVVARVPTVLNRDTISSEQPSKTVTTPTNVQLNWIPTKQFFPRGEGDYAKDAGVCLF